jgi:L-aminopeptidase/D-esterase-like protein
MYNNITDVPGVEVGYSTLILGEPEDYVSDESMFARTGVTAILPRGKNRSSVVAAYSNFNGYGELTGVPFIDDYGQIDGPIMLTNTFSVGVVRDATYKWWMQNDLIDELIIFGEAVEGATLMYPVVGETYDGAINNARGFHIKEEHAFGAIENASAGPIEEGSVGGGTGMQCHLFKGGSGSSSRKLSDEDGGYTLGVFVQANHGYRDRFMIKGIPMGQLIKGCDLVLNGIAPQGGLSPKPGTGSIIVVMATDAPVSSLQIKRLCKRMSIGIGLLGGGCENGSGDVFVGFSTAHTTRDVNNQSEVRSMQSFPDGLLDPLHEAVVDATEEAILNALIAAETMVGINGNTLHALPHDQVRDILKEYGRLAE